MRIAATTVFALAILVLALPTAATAQEGCKASKLSCSQMLQYCEKNCQSANNAGRCLAACSTPVAGCKSNGIWKSIAGGAACWKTDNRT